MERKIYYVHFDARNEPGVRKKIEAQINEFSKVVGKIYEIDLEKSKVNPSFIDKVAVCTPIFYRNMFRYDKALNEIDNNSIVYIRRTKANKYYMQFLRELKKRNCIVLIEIPTYPYFKDDFSKMMYWPLFFKEVFAIPQFKKYVDRFITYSHDSIIFGVPTIRVKNGIYVDQVDVRKPVENANDTINILAVATFRKQHGYERIIKGIHEYYEKGGQRNIILRMVGTGKERAKYERLVKNYHLLNNVLFLGQMEGEELSHQYDIADLALGPFGLYKIDVFSSSALKIREYMAKGLPVVSGCNEDAFSEVAEFDYYLEFDNNNSVVEIEKIIYFCDQIYKEKSKDEIANSIREYAKKYVDYDVVFLKIIDYIKEAM